MPVFCTEKCLRASSLLCAALCHSGDAVLDTRTIKHPYTSPSLYHLRYISILYPSLPVPHLPYTPLFYTHQYTHVSIHIHPHCHTQHFYTHFYAYLYTPSFTHITTHFYTNFYLHTSLLTSIHTSSGGDRRQSHTQVQPTIRLKHPFYTADQEIGHIFTPTDIGRFSQLKTYYL